MPVTVDLSNVTSDGFVLLAPGAYAVTVTKAEGKVSPTSNQPYIALELTVFYPEAVAGVRLYHNLSLTPQALWKLKSTLVALGYDPDDLTGQLTINEEDLVGLQAMAEVSNRKYQGKERNNVDALVKIDPAALQVAEDTSAQAF